MFFVKKVGLIARLSGKMGSMGGLFKNLKFLIFFAKLRRFYLEKCASRAFGPNYLKFCISADSEISSALTGDFAQVGNFLSNFCSVKNRLNFGLVSPAKLVKICNIICENKRAYLNSLLDFNLIERRKNAL